MVKKLVLTNIFSIGFIILGTSMFRDENITIMGALIFLLCVLAYIVLNLTMLILNVIQKNNVPLQDYRYSFAFYLFNLLYPILVILISK